MYLSRIYSENKKLNFAKRISVEAIKFKKSEAIFLTKNTGVYCA